jgi:hypothetical protein
MNGEESDNQVRTEIAGTAIQLENMSAVDRMKILLHLKGYVDGYSKCWTDAQKIVAPHLEEDTRVAVSHVAAEAKMKLNTRFTLLQQEVERLGHAEREGDRTGDGTDSGDDSVPEESEELPSK